jgi:hypothetical protein
MNRERSEQPVYSRNICTRTRIVARLFVKLHVSASRWSFTLRSVFSSVRYVRILLKLLKVELRDYVQLSWFERMNDKQNYCSNTLVIQCSILETVLSDRVCEVTI